MSSNSDNIAAWSTIDRESIEQFGEEGDLARRELLNPILFELMGNVAGKCILDAGCGTGYLSRMLARKGALVTGVEPALPLYVFCIEQEEQTSLGISYLQGDLSKYRTASTFDVVVANMVLMDISDYKSAMKSCVDSLKPGGVFVFSILHPCFPGTDAEWKELRQVQVTEYFDRPPRKQVFGESWDRPIQDYVSVLKKYGCQLTNFVEPRPTRPMVEDNPEWERNYHVPQFLVIRAQKQ